MSTWHADEETITAYASGRIDEARAFSLESHLLACPTCRDACARSTSTDRLERVWLELVDVMDRPRPRFAERLLRRLGLPEHLARLIGATPSLQLSWFAALGVTLLFAVAAGFAARSAATGSEALIFLLVAPLLPLAGIAAAFGPGMDPTYEVGLASPVSGFRLLMLRSIAVLASSAVLISMAAVAVPGPSWTTGAWLLPSLCLVASTLALSSAGITPLISAGTLALVWLTAIALIERASPTPLAGFRGSAQIAFLAVAIGAAVLVAMRREHFEQDHDRG